MLPRGDAAEMVSPRRRVGLVVEDRRVAGMGDEIADVGTLGQMAGIRRRSVEDDDDRAAGESRNELARHRADGGVGHGEDGDCRAGDGGVGIDAGRAESFADTVAAGRVDLDMAGLEARAGEIAGEPHAHLAPGPEQGDHCHHSLPRSRPFTGGLAARPQGGGPGVNAGALPAAPARPLADA